MDFKMCPVFIALFVLCSLTEGRVNILDITTKQVYDIAVTRNIRRPVLVYFTKTYCASCNNVRKSLEEFARQNDEHIDVAIVDIQKRPEFKELFDVKVVPTTRAFDKGVLQTEIKGPSWYAIKKIATSLMNQGS